MTKKKTTKTPAKHTKKMAKALETLKVDEYTEHVFDGFAQQYGLPTFKEFGHMTPAQQQAVLDKLTHKYFPGKTTQQVIKEATGQIMDAIAEKDPVSGIKPNTNREDNDNEK